jgi:SPP1 family predicted phage head-tail adaptor
MDRRVEILEARETGRTASGQPILQWVPIANLWAKRWDLGGTERFAAQQTAAKVEAVYQIRWRTGITPANKLRDRRDTKTYDITAVLEPKGSRRREKLEIQVIGRAEAP